MIRRAGSGEEQDAEDNYYTGLVVEARYLGRPKWSLCTIVKTNLDGTYNVEYNDGDLNRVEKVRFGVAT